MSLPRVRSPQVILALCLAWSQLAGGPLQVALTALHAGHARPLRCEGNHRVCGCAPRRVAERSCCCYQRFAPCCVANRNAGDENPGRPLDTSPVPELAVAPCGDGGAPVAAIPGSGEAVPAAVAAVGPSPCSAPYPARSIPPYPGPRPAPPDPPPKVFAPA